MKIDLSDKMLLAYLEGEVTQSQAAAIDAALADAPADRRRLERLRAMLGHLAGTPEELDAVDLVPQVRQAIAALPAPAPRQRQVWPLLAAAAALLVTTSSLVAGGLLSGERATMNEGAVAQGRASGGDPEFRVKSAQGQAGPTEAQAHAESDRWVGITAYRVPADAAEEPPRRVSDRMRRGDGLLFSFDNLGPAPFAYLMIFAVDGAGEVYWFHPAYEDAGADPVSISITGSIADTTGATGERGQSAIELPDLVHHDYRAGELAIYGLFTRAPVHVSAVEGAIATLVRSGSWNVAQPPRLPIPDSGQQVVPVQVEP
jgi:hypothetical protein